MKKGIKHKVLSAVLTIVALVAGQSSLFATTWKVEGTDNRFVIKRNDATYRETIKYRTIGLTAFDGQNFTAVAGEHTFGPGDYEFEVVVSENMAPSLSAFQFQKTLNRTYRFEVTDQAGFVLASRYRYFTSGTRYTGGALSPFRQLTYTVFEGSNTNYKLFADDGYIVNPYLTFNASRFDSNVSQAWLSAIGAQIRMTFSFDAVEIDDAYEYVQILVDDTLHCDNRDDCSNGDPGNINLSRYMAGFEIHTKETINTPWHNFTFPVLSVGNDEGASDPWGYGDKYPLKKQRFNTNLNSRAADGRIILPTDFSKIVFRFNASGTTGTDEWAVKNVKVSLEAIDNRTPKQLFIKANPGLHAKANTFYVSVAFSEVVKVSSDATLSTNWGDMTYLTGDETNVLTFEGVISDTATEALKVTGYTGTITDVAGHSISYAGGISGENLCALDSGDVTYNSLTDFKQDAEGTYIISSCDDLRGFSGFVNNHGYLTGGLTFRQVNDITLPYLTEWDDASSTENNFAAIGHDRRNNCFYGTYDGGGHTISGIRIYNAGTTNFTDDFKGLFGVTSNFFSPTSTPTIKNVNLADTRITGWDFTGAIVGEATNTLIQDCTVEGNVAIHAVNTSSNHGGIVGFASNTSVVRCITRARLTTAASNCTQFGGIAGWSVGSRGVFEDNLVIGVTIPDVSERGAIIGYPDSDNLNAHSRNYYYNCTVAGVANATGVGINSSDNNGARSIHALNLADGISASRGLLRATLPGGNITTYDNGAVINGIPYYVSGDDIILSYSPLEEGEQVTYTATAGTISGNTLTMPAQDVTVSATITPVPWAGTGTPTDPYIIIYASQLEFLSSTCNNGETYSNTFFKLGADIDMSERSDFTPIGCDENNVFCGTFDGDGYTICNLTVNSSEAPTGLFGIVYGGTLKNVFLDNATITGTTEVAAIAGSISNSAEVSNCFVINSSISGTNNVGIIVGTNDSSCTIDDNHYSNVTLGTAAPASDVNILAAINGAIVSTTPAVTYKGTNYYVGGDEISVTCSSIPDDFNGFMLIYDDGTIHFSHLITATNGQASFTMPDVDASIAVNDGNVIDIATLIGTSTIPDGKILVGTLGDNNRPKILIADGATVTLNGIYIPGYLYDDHAGLSCEGDATIILAEGSTNTVFGYGYKYPGVTVPTGKTLTIEGEGTLNATSYSSTSYVGQGAGIGCGYGSSCGTIIINSGIINATGGQYSAGIGGSRVSTYYSTFDAIIINGGTINATGGQYGPGIGQGCSDGTPIRHITINGGTVNATGGEYGAGIGSGRDGDDQRLDININGGTITATGGVYGAGIGSGGQDGKCRNINITGGNITALAGQDGAGIGSGGMDLAYQGSGFQKYTSCKKITISGGTVVATGNGCGAGIGCGGSINDPRGWMCLCDTITITGDINSVIATKGSTANAAGHTYKSQPIGFGYNCGDDHNNGVPVFIDASLSDVTEGNTRTIRPAVLFFADDADNTADIERLSDLGSALSITIQDRTLYKDGAWNTLCLPFDMSEEEVFDQLNPSAMMTINSTSLSDEGTLYLNFIDASTIQAGTPYIIKWQGGDHITNPVFNGVFISNATNDFISADGKVEFKGTYAPINFDTADKSILFMGAENTLYYPMAGARINAFHAYFKINFGGNEVKRFVLNFDREEDDPTVVKDLKNLRDFKDEWYDLNGRKLSGKPSQKGIYINNGKKTIIK